MSGKMERSLWRPLLVAILIMVLTSTVLCNKKKRDIVGDQPPSFTESVSDAEKSGTKIDLVFIVDASSEICNEGDKSIIHPIPCPSCPDLIRDVVGELNNGDCATRVSVVTYSTTATIRFQLNTIMNTTELQSAIESLPDVTGDRNIAAAFDAVTNQVFVESAGDRPDANNMVIVITHRNPTVDMDQVTRSLSELRNKASRIISVGVGNQVTEEFVRSISSEPQQLGKDYFLADNHDQLKNFIGPLTKSACKPGPGSTTESSTTTTPADIPNTALTDCRLTTTTEIYSFSAEDQGRCTTLEKVTVTKCSGSCSDSVDVGRVFIGDKMISPKDNSNYRRCKGTGSNKTYDALCVADDGSEKPIIVTVEEFTECACKIYEGSTTESSTTTTPADIINPALTDCRLTTTTEIYKFSTEDQGRCTMHQEVTVTKCSGSCSDSVDVGRVFIDNKMISPKENSTFRRCKGTGSNKTYDAVCVADDGSETQIIVTVEEFTECACKIYQVAATTVSPTETNPSASLSTAGLPLNCTGQNLTNTVVYENTTDASFPSLANGQTLQWGVISASDAFNAVEAITYPNDTMNPQFANSYTVTPSQLGIINATVDARPPSIPFPTAGLYILDYPNTNCTYGANLIVIRSGPDCSCDASDPNNVQLICSVDFAQSSFQPNDPVFTWTDDTNTVKKSERPIPEYTSNSIERSSSTFIVNSNDPTTYTCQLTFSAAAQIKLDYVTSTAPTFTKSCQVKNCAKESSTIVAPEDIPKLALTELTDCRLTTSTSKLEFGSQDYGQCKTREDVTVTKCSGFCSDSADVGRVFIDNKTISLKENSTCRRCMGTGSNKTYDAVCVADDGSEKMIIVTVEEFTECSCKIYQATTVTPTETNPSTAPPTARVPLNCTGQNLTNTVVYENTTDASFPILDNGQTVQWTVISASHPFEGVDAITHPNGTMDPQFANTYAVTPSQLGIINATVDARQPSIPIATAGLYILDYLNPNCTYAANLIVIRSGPDCSCDASDPDNVRLNCTVDFAQSKVQPNYPVFTWTDGTNIVKPSEQPEPWVTSYPMDRSSSSFVVNSNDPTTYTCQLTFSVAAQTPLNFVTSTAPIFTKSCQVQSCAVA